MSTTISGSFAEKDRSRVGASHFCAVENSGSFAERDSKEKESDEKWSRVE